MFICLVIQCGDVDECSLYIICLIYHIKTPQSATFGVVYLFLRLYRPNKLVDETIRWDHSLAQGNERRQLASPQVCVCVCACASASARIQGLSKVTNQGLSNVLPNSGEFVQVDKLMASPLC